MPDDELEDPAANTERFQAFVDNYPESQRSGSRWAWAAFAVVAALVVVVALLWFLLGG